MYRSEVHYEYIARAGEFVGCPILANGNVSSAAKAFQVLERTKARGVMIGRGAIRNPWMFTQIRQIQASEQIFRPTGREVLAYIQELYEAVRPDPFRESAQVQKMKKYLNFIGLGVEPTGKFLHEIRRAKTEQEFFEICAAHLDHGELMDLEPFSLDLKETDVLAGDHL
jgi:tRNA-dihydrouridine synthase